MSASLSGRRSLVSFRLDQVPLHVRLRAKETLLRGRDPKLPSIGGPTAVMDLALAADHPSARVYWIPADAYERVMKTTLQA